MLAYLLSALNSLASAEAVGAKAEAAESRATKPAGARPPAGAQLALLLGCRAKSVQPVQTVHGCRACASCMQGLCVLKSARAAATCVMLTGRGRAKRKAADEDGPTEWEWEPQRELVLAAVAAVMKVGGRSAAAAARKVTLLVPSCVAQQGTPACRRGPASADPAAQPATEPAAEPPAACSWTCAPS